MTLGIRKVIVLGLLAGVFLTANALLVTSWLADTGVINFAKYIRTEYLTGTAIAVIIVLLILLINPKNSGRPIGFIRRCPVCDHRLIGSPQYCGDCGSKVS